ncbi:hypothetical protein LTR66_004273 [Elasticomyces elasticus]|nr:hypothetical protein LTR66_004273 [Elasticomyces elasticus]
MPQTARRAYSAEELLAMRRSVSGGPLLEIEDGVKDPNNQSLGAGTHKPGPSPTPSIKKKKAEQILKQHGSPPTLRVTAGGRIVPSDQSPLCSPRYGYSAINKNGGFIKFSPNYPLPPSASEISKTTPNGFVAQDMTGRLCQLVDGHVMPLNEVNGRLELFIPAPNLNMFFPADAAINHGPTSLAQSRFPQALLGTRGGSTNRGSNMSAHDIPFLSQIQALEKEHSKLDEELIELNKAEVLQRSRMTPAIHAQLVQKRRTLVIGLDEIRKSIKDLKQQVGPLAPGQQNLRNTLPPFPPVQRPPFAQHFALPPAAQQQAWPVFAPPPPPDNAFNRPFLNEPGLFNPSTANALQPFTSRMPSFGVPQPYLPMPAPDPAVIAMGPPQLHVAQPSSVGGSQGVAVDGTDCTDMAVPVAQVHGIEPSTASVYQDVYKKPVTSQTSGVVASANPSPTQKYSHALSIKKPQNQQNQHVGAKSALNPACPSWQPAAALQAKEQPTTPDRSTVYFTPQRQPAEHSTSSGPAENLANAVEAHNAWVDRTGDSSEDSTLKARTNSSRRNDSFSSFETADFFPRNPREHSHNMLAYPKPAERSSTKEDGDEKSFISSRTTQLVTPVKGMSGSEWNPPIPDEAFEHTTPPSAPDRGPAPPSNTPAGARTPTWSHEDDPVPNRSELNLSPKNRRPSYLLSYKFDSNLATRGSDIKLSCVPSPTGVTQQQDDDAASATDERILRPDKSRAWNEGYSAGVRRSPISPDRTGDFVEGYCGGLMSSNAPLLSPTPRPSPAKSTAPEQITQEPATTADHGHPRLSSEFLRTDRRDAFSIPPLEYRASDFDTMKEAIQVPSLSNTLRQAAFSPSNENAVLTPDAEGPPMSSLAGDLGAWEQSRQSSASTDKLLMQMRKIEANFPTRTSSIVKRVVSGNAILGMHQKSPAAIIMTDSTHGPHKPLPTLPPGLQHSGNESRYQSLSEHQGLPTRSASSTMYIPTQSPTRSASNLYRHYPGTLVFSPHLEWKSASSIAQAAGMAKGYFAQYDGANGHQARTMHTPPLTAVSGNAGTTVPTAGTNLPSPASVPLPGSVAKGKARALEETKAKNDVLAESGQLSPTPAADLVSPPMSPKLKSVSPAKARFEQIAAKVGVKVSRSNTQASPANVNIGNVSAATSPSPKGGRAARLERTRTKEEQRSSDGTPHDLSPQEKRRWREVWRKRVPDGKQAENDDDARR